MAAANVTEISPSQVQFPVPVVKLYTVFIGFTCLLLISLPGLLFNVAVLISTRCKKGIRNLQYGFHYTLFTVNILFTVVSIPLHVTLLVCNYNNWPVGRILCCVTRGVFHMCIAGNTALVVSIGVLHLHHLSSSQLPIIRGLVKRGITGSIICALLIAIVTAFTYPIDDPLSFHFFNNDSISSENSLDISTLNYTYSLTNLISSVVYIVTLLVLILLLWLAVNAIRHQIHEMLNPAVNKPSSHGSAGVSQDCYPDDQYEISRGDEPSKHSSVTFKDPPEIAETIPSNGGLSKVTGNSVSGGKGFKFKNFNFKSKALKETWTKEMRTAAVEENDEDDDDDDQMFEMKMKLRLQQKSNSGRRHTVANIGLGDSLFGKRRGSLDVQKSPSNHEPGYNYVRKWSVDITALQNQLENPKIHTGSYPFRDLGILPEKDVTPPEEEEEEIDNNESGTSATANSTHEEKKEGKDEVEKQEEAKNKQLKQKENKTSTISIAQTAPEMSSVSDSVSIDRRHPCSLTEVPSIVIDDGMEDCEWQTDHTEENQQLHKTPPEEAKYVDEEIIQRFQKQLKKSKHILLFYCLTLASFCPYFITAMLQPVLGYEIGLNLLYITMNFCIVATVVQPITLVWIDTRLREAARRLWFTMTHWKCVCYCNIGRGKKFFGKPIELEEHCNSRQQCDF